MGIIVMTIKAPAVVALMAVAATGCSTPASDPALLMPPPRDACVSTTHSGAETPLTAPATATAFTASPVPMSYYMQTGGDTITGQQAILDFPVGAHVVPADQAVALTSFTVHTTDPAGWQLSRSFDAVAFWTLDGTNLAQQFCPDQSPGVLAAMRVAGHQPLPERIEPGSSATGWVAFVVPRSSTAINLWMRHLDPDGGYAGAETALLHTAPK